MRIAYKDLFRGNYLVYVPGPAGFFAKRFKESGYSEAELIDLIKGMDFSLPGVDKDISLKKKCKIIERAVAESHYTNWALSLVGMIISLAVGACLPTLATNHPFLFVVLVGTFPVVLGAYARFRLRFERNRTVLLCALDYIKTLKP